METQAPRYYADYWPISVHGGDTMDKEEENFGEAENDDQARELYRAFKIRKDQSPDEDVSHHRFGSLWKIIEESVVLVS